MKNDDEMTITRLLRLDDVAHVMETLNSDKESIDRLVVLYTESDGRLRWLASAIPLAELLGWLDMAKFAIWEDLPSLEEEKCDDEV
jgi:hypothetical protein